MSLPLPFLPRLMAMTPTQWPHRDPQPIVNTVVATESAALTIPSFPKLLKIGSEQVAQGMPCLVADPERRRFYFDTSDPALLETELTVFYEHYLANDVDYFAISPEASPGLHRTLEALKGRSGEGRFISCSVGGPITFTMQTTDENNKPIFYNEALRDAAVKTLEMKARWLYRAIKQAVPGAIVGCRFAEPLLSLYGTPFASLPREEILSCLNACFTAAPGPTTVHCCANIDWPILFETATDIIHFDAFEYADKLALYPYELQAYLDRGGLLAWGIVPANNDKLLGETVDSLVARFEQGLDCMEAHGLKRKQLLETAFLQPSCSLGTMTEELAERAFHYTLEMSNLLRASYFGG